MWEAARSERTVESWLRALLVGAFCALCYYSLEHSWNYARMGVPPDQEEGLENVIGVTQVHSVIRDGSLAALALGGGAMVMFGHGRRCSPNWTLIALCTATILWILAGYALASDRGYVLRRFVGCLGALAGAMGVAWQLRPRDVVRMAWAAFTGFVLLSLAADFAGGANPLASDYRFSGTLHPNPQGIYCSISFMASVCLARMEKQRWLFYGTAALALTLLVLTKSRGSMFALVGALAVMWIARRQQMTRMQAWATLLSAASALLIAFACLDNAAVRAVRETLLLGRTEAAGSFSGRVPLWEELIQVYAPSRIWTGYGFGGFWTEDRIEEIYLSQKWAMGNAHNLYLDLVLQMGVVGFVVVITTWAGLFVSASRYHARTGDDAYIFYTGIFSFVAVNSSMEAIFLHPTKLPTLLAMSCAMSLVWFEPENGRDRRARIDSPGPAWRPPMATTAEQAT